MALENEKEKLRIQQEYEDSLKISQSFLEGIDDLIDNSAKNTKNLSDNEKKYNSALKSILQGVKTKEEAIAKIDDCFDREDHYKEMAKLHDAGCQAYNDSKTRWDNFTGD